MNFLITVLVVLLVIVAIAFSFVRFVVVQEAKAVAFKFLGRFAYLAMEFKDYHFDSDGNIQTGPGSNNWGSCRCIWRIGGLVIYIHPLVKPANYAEQNNPDRFGEGIYVHLGDITPEPFVETAETAPPENIGLNVKFVSTMRVVNPYRWLFPSPKDVNAQVVKRQNSALRAWVGSGDQKHVQQAKGNGVQLWSELVQPVDDEHPNALNCKPTFDKIENEWGLKILENSIIVEDVGYDPEYQKALKAKDQAKLQADASVEETAGRVLRSVARMSGVNVDDPDELKGFMKKLSDKPELRGKPALQGGYKEAFEYAEDQTKRDRAGGGLQDFRMGSADGTPLPGSLQYLSVGGGGGMGVMMGGKKGKGGGDGKRPDEGKDDRDRWAAEETFKQAGQYPSWWDPQKKQRR